MKTDVADIDFQHEIEPFAANHVIWGVGYHYTRVSVDDSPFFRTTSNYRKDSQFGGFIQDEISLIEDELRLTIGSKVEHNDSTGAEIQPSALVLWSPTIRQSAWAGVSRAVRLPFIAEEEVDMTYRVEPPFTPENPGALPVEIRFLGNPGIVAEDVLSFEVGYRAQPSDRLSLDTTAFYNFYDGLRAFVTGTPFFAPTPDPRVVVPARWEDNQSAETWGVEVAADWKVFAWRPRTPTSTRTSRWTRSGTG